MPDELAKTTPRPPAPLRQVLAWIIEGQSQQDIADAIAAKFPNARARPLIVSALKKLAEEGAEPDPDLIRGFCLEATREIYRKSSEVGDHQTALRSLKQLMELARK